jgi:hypothetical protein
MMGGSANTYARYYVLTAFALMRKVETIRKPPKKQAAGDAISLSGIVRLRPQRENRIWRRAHGGMKLKHSGEQDTYDNNPGSRSIRRRDAVA